MEVQSLSALFRVVSSKNSVAGTSRIVDHSLQELIVTPGWSVGYHAFHAVDPTRELVTDRDAFFWFKQDLFQACHDRGNRLMDLGWTPEGDWDDGAYKLVLYAGDFHGELLRQLRTKSRTDIVTAMNKWFCAVSNGEL